MPEDTITNSIRGPGLVPIGSIIAYVGRPEDLDPRHWQLCDGNAIRSGPLAGNLTPKMGDVFLRGTTDPAQNGQVSGDDSHSHPAVGDVGGTFTGNGSGRTARESGQRYGWGDNREVHPQNEGDNCYTYEWNVNVSVSGSIRTNPHEHPAARHVPRHLKVLFIMRIE